MNCVACRVHVYDSWCLRDEGSDSIGPHPQGLIISVLCYVNPVFTTFKGTFFLWGGGIGRIQK